MIRKKEEGKEDPKVHRSEGTRQGACTEFTENGLPRITKKHAGFYFTVF